LPRLWHDCSPLAATILRRRHIDYVDIADALQRGFMVFYEQLSADPNMLVGQSKYAVADPVCNNCHQNYWARHRRHFSFDALDNGNTDHPDEWLVTGLEAHRSEKWAAWATATDTRMDIEQAMGELVERYEQVEEPHGSRLLVALYYMTTQVTLKDAATVAGINYHYLLDRYVCQVRKHVKEAFGEFYQPGVRWMAKYKRGYLQPAKDVLDRYVDNPRMTYAINSLLEEKSTTEDRLACPWPNSRRFRQRAKEALMKAYNCSA